MTIMKQIISYFTKISSNQVIAATSLVIAATTFWGIQSSNQTSQQTLERVNQTISRFDKTVKALEEERADRVMPFVAFNPHTSAVRLSKDNRAICSQNDEEGFEPLFKITNHGEGPAIETEISWKFDHRIDRGDKEWGQISPVTGNGWSQGNIAPHASAGIYRIPSIVYADALHREMKSVKGTVILTYRNHKNKEFETTQEVTINMHYDSPEYQMSIRFGKILRPFDFSGWAGW